MRYWVQLATEHFAPSELVDQAVEAEQAGFDGLNVSDHFQPWWEPGHSGQAWVLLGAIGRATDRIAVGTGVTAPVYRYNPAVAAQFGAALHGRDGRVPPERVWRGPARRPSHVRGARSAGAAGRARLGSRQIGKNDPW